MFRVSTYKNGVLYRPHPYHQPGVGIVRTFEMSDELAKRIYVFSRIGRPTLDLYRDGRESIILGTPEPVRLPNYKAMEFFHWLVKGIAETNSIWYNDIHKGGK